MTDEGPVLSVAASYRAYARLVARGRSAEYEALAEAVADDPAVLDFLYSLPPDKRQPNLLFAAARYLLETSVGITQLRALASQASAELSEVMRSRSTQTNEPARCATLIPTLALLPPPLALLEVGASAGLTLLVDRYSYDFAGHRILGSDPQAPILRCTPRGPVPLPRQLPAVVWRAGLDLNPLDVHNDEDVRWLSCLKWPDEGEHRLTAAIATARRDPPVIHRGDMCDDLPALAAQAPADATLVVYHSAVLAYVSPDKRQRFTGMLADLAAVWLSNEAPGIVPHMPALADRRLPFVLARDGQAPMALTDPHGTWLQWLSTSAP